MDLQSQFNSNPHINPVFIFFLKPGERTHVGVQIQVEVDDGFHVIVVVVRDAQRIHSQLYGTLDLRPGGRRGVAGKIRVQMVIWQHDCLLSL